MSRNVRKAAPRSRNQLRIIAGQWRGRRLPFPDAEGLRPTGDRIRETLFNWLSPQLHSSHCLDAFAGSGALGFEALSRGAAEVVMIESNPAVFRQLQASRELLGATGATLVKDSAPQWLATADCRPFDVVFLDPPFAGDLLQQVIEVINQRSLLAPNAFIYIETGASATPLLPASWLPVREKHSGDVCYRLLRCD